MAGLAYWAHKATLEFRNNTEAVDMNGFYASFNIDGDVLWCSDVPLLRREAHHFSIRWPSEGLAHWYAPATTRAVLNAMLNGLSLRASYRFTITFEDKPSFWMRERGKWRDQNLVMGEWCALVDGELARMALHAERRAARKAANITTVVTR